MEFKEELQEMGLLEEVENASKREIMLKEAQKIQSPIISAQQIVSLLSKTPDKYKYERPAKGGGKWTYVSGGYVKKTLNRIFGWNWSFEIVDKFKDEGEVVVQGRLVIRNKEGQVMIIKEDFGKKEIMKLKNSPKALSIGNDYKSAGTDCLKRCAFQLGLASDVYAPQEYKELENPDEAILYDEKDLKGQFSINCEVCGKEFTSDKSFLKECAECAKLTKEEKQKIKEERIKKEEEINF